MQQEFNEHTSLQLIESMINRAKDKFSENGTLYMLWGIVVFICSLVQFIGIYYYGYTQIYYVWFLTWLVLIYQMVFLSRKKKAETVRTYTADILKYVWLCFVCCLFVAIFTLQVKQAYSSINPTILVLYAVPTFLSGIILKFRPLVAGGAFCWALAIGSVFAPFAFQSLFICVAVVAAWIIPGILLRIKYRRQMLS